MARRFGRFNPNQKRDKNGKWTSGGGSSKRSKSGGKKKKPLTKTQRENRKRVRTGALLGGTIGFLGTFGTPVGTVAGAAIGAGLVARKNRKSRR